MLTPVAAVRVGVACDASGCCAQRGWAQAASGVCAALGAKRCLFAETQLKQTPYASETNGAYSVTEPQKVGRALCALNPTVLQEQEDEEQDSCPKGQA